MELKVWVEGIQRIVCGVTVNTTCQDVVFALAHATGKVGRFTLIERWRNNERLLAPNENPLKLLLKWGEYANDVQFILQRSENKQQQQQLLSSNIEKESLGTIGNNSENRINQIQTVMTKKPLGLSNNNNKNISNKSHINNNNNTNNTISINSNSNISVNNIIGINTNEKMHHQQQDSHNIHQQSFPKQQNDINLKAASERTKELRKSFGACDKQIENIGIVKGIPQQQNQNKINNNITNITSNSIAKYSPTNNNVIVKSIPTTIKTTPNSPTSQIVARHEKSHSNPIEMTSSNSNNFDQISANKKNIFNDSNSNSNIYSQIGAYNSKSTNEINLAEVRESLDRRTLVSNVPTNCSNSTSSINNRNNDSLKQNVISSNKNYSNCNNTFDIVSNNINCTTNDNIINNENNNNSIEENLVDIYNINTTNISPLTYDSPDIIPTISSNGALVPPPYRNPPPPRNSPMQRIHNDQSLSQSPAMSASSNNSTSNGIGHQTSASTFLNDFSTNYEEDFQLYTGKTYAGNNNMEESESIFQATQYNDLLQLIKFQREKISSQQVELSKYDAEIVFLENKERDQAQELESISRDITKVDQLFRLGSEQLQSLQYVEEENELVKQQEKTLKSEIALLRSKLANCETELLQCKNKIRLLMDDIEIEQRALSQKQKHNRQHIERDFLMEMERIQNEIDQAISNTDSSTKTADNLKKEIMLIEQAIGEKKRQVEKLVNEMKEVNLQSLQVVTSEEVKHLFEGPQKQGSSRRIIGSPRQLENAVPTSKNPHGVWV